MIDYILQKRTYLHSAVLFCGKFKVDLPNICSSIVWPQAQLDNSRDQNTCTCVLAFAFLSIWLVGFVCVMYLCGVLFLREDDSQKQSMLFSLHVYFYLFELRVLGGRDGGGSPCSIYLFLLSCKLLSSLSLSLMQCNISLLLCRNFSFSSCKVLLSCCRNIFLFLCVWVDLSLSLSLSCCVYSSPVQCVSFTKRMWLRIWSWGVGGGGQRGRKWPPGAATERRRDEWGLNHVDIGSSWRRVAASRGPPVRCWASDGQSVASAWMQAGTWGWAPGTWSWWAAWAVAVVGTAETKKLECITHCWNSWNKF